MILGITVQDCVNQGNNTMKVDNVWFATPVFYLSKLRPHIRNNFISAPRKIENVV